MVILDQAFHYLKTAHPMGFLFFIIVMETRADLLPSFEMVDAGSRGMKTKYKRFGVKLKSQKARRELLCPLLNPNIFSPAGIEPDIHLVQTDIYSEY